MAWVVHGQVEKEVDRDRSTANDMEKVMNAFSGPTERGENPKERLGKLKPDLSLIPQSVLVLEALAMMEGAAKYGPYNWRQTKVQARTYIAASMRHLAAWLDGEEEAPDSGIHHLAHARASLGVVMDAQVCGMMVDDRVKGEAGRVLVENIRTFPKEGVNEHTRYIYASVPEVGISAKIPSDAPDPLLQAALGASTIPSPTFYLSGPMREIPDFNFPAFDAARDKGHSLGYNIINPADMDRAAGIDENTDEGMIDVRTFVKRDIAALLSLSPKRGDGIALLPGWDRSTGALAELMVARWLGLQVVSALTFVGYKTGSPAEIIAEAAAEIYRYGGVI